MSKKNEEIEMTVLGLRTCNSDMSSYGGFVWSRFGTVVCPDWNPSPVCGGGLHFLMWGEGDGRLLNWDENAVWMVVRASEYVELNGKVKAPSVEVVFCGSRNQATEYLRNNGGEGRAIVGGTATAGDGGTATAGYKGTATAGDGGTATAGDGGTATAGDGGTLIIKRWNGKRYKFFVGYVGEDGIEANVPSLLSANGDFGRVS
jgi:hypothetical protein